MIYFVVPVYKVENYLARCVDSIIGQTYNDVHIVLVDDGSPDNCPEICDRLASRHSNIKVIHKPNGGLSDARNAGIDYVMSVADKDDYITFLDSDDFVHEKYAEIMVGLCNENGCDSAQCGYEKGDGNNFTSDIIVEKPLVVSGKDALLNQRVKSQSCAKIYKIHTFENVRYPLNLLNEDEFTTWKAIYNSSSVALIDQKLYYYFQHSNSIMDVIARKLKGNPHRTDWLKAYEERIAFFEKQNEPQQVMRTKEKICTDIILRYTEQMWLKPHEREESCVNGEYVALYRQNFKKMFPRKGISLKRRLMYIAFYLVPSSSVIMGKILGLRK